MKSKNLIHCFGIQFGILITLLSVACADRHEMKMTFEANMTFEQFLAQVYQEPESGLYIVDGDTPIRGIEELREFYFTYLRNDHVTTQPGIGRRRSGLIVNTVRGVDDSWNETQRRNATYCVSTAFGSNYNAVVRAMLDATSGGWEEAAGVRLPHLAGEDNNCTADNNNVVFNVSPTSGQPYLARAFFPSFGRVNRNILIDTSSFGPIGRWTLAGILRHEVGHALGFRHEHTRPEAGRCFEDNNWRPLTPYDSDSVMHYPQCNGTNRGDLVLTQRDREGAAALYPVSLSRVSTNVLWRHADGQVAIWLMDGTTIRSEVYPRLVGNDWQIQGTGDFDADGNGDILWRNVNGQTAIWFMNGGTIVGESYPGGQDPGGFWQIQGVGDFDGDGYSDILWRDSNGQLAIWFRGDSTAVAYPSYGDQPSPVPLEWQVQGIGDFNRDGRSDILWRNTNGQVAIWFMSGGIRVGESYPGGQDPSLYWRIQTVGDFDCDGYSDILWRAGNGQLAIWFRGNSALDYYPGYGDQPLPVPLDWQVQGVGDFNRDCRADILWRDTNGQVAIWLMSGARFRGDVYPRLVDDSGWQIKGLLKAVP